MDVLGTTIGNSPGSSPSIRYISSFVLLEGAEDDGYQPDWHDDFRDDSPGRMYGEENNTTLLKSLDNRYRLTGDLNTVFDKYGNQFFAVPDGHGGVRVCDAFFVNGKFTYQPVLYNEYKSGDQWKSEYHYRYFIAESVDAAPPPNMISCQYFRVQTGSFTVKDGQEPGEGSWLTPTSYFYGFGIDSNGRYKYRKANLDSSIRQYWPNFREWIPKQLISNWDRQLTALPNGWQTTTRWALATKVRPDVGMAFDKSFADMAVTEIWTHINRIVPRLCNRCLNEVEFFDGNGIALISDLVSLCQLITGNIESITDLFKIAKHAGSHSKSVSAIRQTRKAAKELSSLYLSYHYGYRLTRSDLLDLRETIINYCSSCKSDAAYATEALTVSDWECKVVMRILYSPYNPCSSLITFCDFFDLAPDLDNLWDLVPYSFIVDWFIGIGDAASTISTFFKLQRSKLLGTTISVKARKSIKSIEWEGETQVELYKRNVMPRWVPVPEVPISFKSPSDPKHFIEGGALVCAK